MESKDKKRLVLIISGVLFMVVIVAVATYAYFSVPIQNEFSETKVHSNIEDVGTVSLLPEATELTLNLSADDMIQKDTDVIYFATKDGATTLTNSEVIAKASVIGNGVFNCTYDITMDATGENNMYEAVYGTNIAPSIELWVDGNRFIFNQANLFPKTISGEILGLTEDVSHDIVAQLALMNDASENQDVLKGTDLEITFTINNFSCNPTTMGESAKYILATSPENISTDLIDGLYRYQGTQEQVTNNYICWGTFNKAECLAENSDYLYRIIGITPDGQLKIIQNKLTNTNFAYSNQLNSSHLPLFPNLTLAGWSNAKWSDLLVQRNWRYGEITTQQFSSFTTVEEILDTEKTFNSVYKSDQGVLSNSDFYNHDTCYKGSNLNYISKCTDGWMLLNNINESYDNSTREWSSVRLNGTNMAFTMNAFGAVNVADMTTELNFRHVAYISPNTIGLRYGTGTITDPYMFS